MNNKNVVLLGGSNSIKFGLRKGLQLGIDAYNQQKNDKLFLHNLSLGTTTCMQNLYEIMRENNRHALNSSELIITESNINDIDATYCEKTKRLPLQKLYRNLFWFYQELYFFRKRVVVLILPYQVGYFEIVNNLHRILCLKFGFNIIDMQDYYRKNNLEEFGNRIDRAHQQLTIMSELGKNIIQNIDNFLYSNIDIVNNDNPNFKIITPKDLEVVSGSLIKNIYKNSFFQELAYRLYSSTVLKINQFKNYHIIALHSWNNGVLKSNNIRDEAYLLTYSTLYFCNSSIGIEKEANFLNSVSEIYSDFIIDNNTYIKTQELDIINCNRESSIAVLSQNENAIKVNYFDLVSLFIASPEGNYHTEKIDFEALVDENIKILKEYNFNHLIPQVELYKEIIDEYCSIMDSRKLTYLEKQIKEKDNIIYNLNKEKTITRIQNQLSYKLGQALILNSKSVLGYLSLPFIILSIIISHKQKQKAYKFKIKNNPNLASPPLETYPDYNEALKAKECFTYKLGQEFIKASKNWYGGGYIKFIFKDVPKLKREFGKKG